ALLAAAWHGGAVPVFARGLAVPAAIAAVTVAIVLAWRAGALGARAVAGALATIVVVELAAIAPRAHPPRLDPYRPPPYVEFLRNAPPDRVVAAAELATPLTSAAAGLRDARAIDVLTPG